MPLVSQAPRPECATWRRSVRYPSVARQSTCSCPQLLIFKVCERRLPGPAPRRAAHARGASGADAERDVVGGAATRSCATPVAAARRRALRAARRGGRRSSPRWRAWMCVRGSQRRPARSRTVETLRIGRRMQGRPMRHGAGSARRGRAARDRRTTSRPGPPSSSGAVRDSCAARAGGADRRTGRGGVSAAHDESRASVHARRRCSRVLGIRSSWRPGPSSRRRSLPRKAGPQIEIRDERGDEGPAAWIGSIGRRLERHEQDGSPFAVLLVELVDIERLRHAEPAEELSASDEPGSRTRSRGSCARPTRSRASARAGTGCWRRRPTGQVRSCWPSGSRARCDPRRAIAGRRWRWRSASRCAPRTGGSASELAAHADVGLYAARAAGRSSIR